MLRKIGYGLAALLVLVLGYAGFALARGSAVPLLPFPSVERAMAQAMTGNDSAAAAAAANRRCGLLVARERKHCFEDVLLHMVKEGKVHLAIRTLELLGQQHDDIRRFGHDYSHVIGINAWRPGLDIGATYAQCTELFQSGCYHGVVQAYFAYEGTDSAKVASLCATTPEITSSAWLRFQCVHGIGHGLLQTYTMNLPHALHGCDMLNNSWDSQSCYGGAFMEFILGGRGQSHHVALPGSGDSAGGGEHANMDHGPATPDTFPPFKAREPSDSLYPCSVLNERYHYACYQMQAGLIVERTGLDFGKVAKVCETAPANMRAVCFQGIGTYVSGVTARDPSEAIRHCSMGANRYRSWCFVGVVKNFIDVTAKTEDGIVFCKRITPEDIATACYHAVGEQAAVLYPNMDRRIQACATAETPYRPACEYGAGLIQERPRALPIP